MSDHENDGGEPTGGDGRRSTGGGSADDEFDGGGFRALNDAEDRDAVEPGVEAEPGAAVDPADVSGNGDVTAGFSGADESDSGAESGPGGLDVLDLPPEKAAIRDAIVADVKAYYDERRPEGDGEVDGPFASLPDDRFIETSFFDFEYLREYEEVERLWVNEPFAYVSVLYSEREREYLYHVTEPVLDEFEQYVRQDLVDFLRTSLMYEEVEDETDKAVVFEERAGDLIAEHAATVDDGSLHKLLYYLRRDFVEFGPIDPIMRDPNIEDVSCDGANVPIFVYHRDYRDLESNVVFDKRHLNSFTVRLAQRSGKQISVSEPLLDATLPDGSRLQLTLGGDVSTRGSNFTIRKFSDVPLTPVDLVEFNTFSVDEMAYFWLAIENNKSLIFVGGTGSGKTTSMNAVSFFIPPTSKIVSIEDTREIDLPHDNWIQSLTRDSMSSEGRGEVTMYELLQAALRQRPEYIVVGEIRTEQRVALTFFQAMGTGHTCYTTLHADSVEAVLNRLQNPPLSVPMGMIQDLDIVSIQRQLFLDDRRVRRNEQITELVSRDGDPNALRTVDVFRRNPETDEHEQSGDSEVLQEIADQRGWDARKLREELRNRKRVLEYLIENDVTDHESVAALIMLYTKDPAFVMEQISADEPVLAIVEGA